MKTVGVICKQKRHKKNQTDNSLEITSPLCVCNSAHVVVKHNAAIISISVSAL